MKNSSQITKICVPMVFCGKCCCLMEIEEWYGAVPHPNRGHECNNCGFYWMPQSGSVGDLMINGIDDISFFWSD